MTEAFGGEHVRNPEELLALHNTLQLSFTDPTDPTLSLEAQREEFAALIAAAQTQFDERAQALIEHYATVVDFLWFGGYNDTLPGALGYFWLDHSADESWGEIDFKGDGLIGDRFDAITQTLMPLGLGDLLRKRLACEAQNKPKIEAAFKAVVDATPTVQWFNAFKVGDPRVEIPLPPLLRAGPAEEIRQVTNRRFGPDHPLQNAETLPPDHVAEIMDALAMIEHLQSRDRAGKMQTQLGMLQAALAPIARLLDQ